MWGMLTGQAGHGVGWPHCKILPVPLPLAWSSRIKIQSDARQGPGRLPGTRNGPEGSGVGVREVNKGHGKGPFHGSGCRWGAVRSRDHSAASQSTAAVMGCGRWVRTRTYPWISRRRGWVWEITQTVRPVPGGGRLLHDRLSGRLSGIEAWGENFAKTASKRRPQPPRHEFEERPRLDSSAPDAAPPIAAAHKTPCATPSPQLRLRGT